jgi:hypothetical protein
MGTKATAPSRAGAPFAVRRTISAAQRTKPVAIRWRSVIANARGRFSGIPKAVTIWNVAKATGDPEEEATLESGPEVLREPGLRVAGRGGLFEFRRGGKVALRGRGDRFYHRRHRNLPLEGRSRAAKPLREGVARSGTIRARRARSAHFIPAPPSAIVQMEGNAGALPPPGRRLRRRSTSPQGGG